MKLFRSLAAGLAALTFLAAPVAAQKVGQPQRVSASFNRPANTTAYASGQLVANSTTAGSVVPMALPVGTCPGCSGIAVRGKLSKTSVSLTNAQFRVHLYRNSPTVANGDGGAWSTTSAIYLGAFDITMDRAFTDQAAGIAVPVVGTALVYDTAAPSTNIYALIEARAAYTPASAETFTFTLETLPD